MYAKLCRFLPPFLCQKLISPGKTVLSPIQIKNLQTFKKEKTSNCKFIR